MAGVDAVYHVGPTIHPREREMGLAVVDAALAAGVGHVVYSAVLHPILTGLLQHALKRDVEERLVSSGLDFTILQPGDFLQSQVRSSVFERARFSLPYSLDRRQSVVDVSDITDVAAKVLLEGAAHAGATYELSSQNVTGHEIAAAIGRVLGREVRATEIPRTAFIERFVRAAGRDGDLAYETAVLEHVCDWYGRHDFLGNPNVLTMLLGRPPITLDEHVRRAYAAWGQRRASSAHSRSPTLP
jgi:uncharacterized protein YbjT (DUF2867 family)